MKTDPFTPCLPEPLRVVQDEDHNLTLEYNTAQEAQQECQIDQMMNNNNNHEQVNIEPINFAEQDIEPKNVLNKVFNCY